MVYTDEIEGPIPEGKWRIGKPTEHVAQIFMRIASVNDLGDAALVTPEVEMDLARKNQQLCK